ncbi:MAG: methionine aminotransferase [Steroidobacteraceae bacterium]
MSRIISKLPHVGTTIFTVMSQRAAELGAINLAQGFPDYDPPGRLKTLLAEKVAAGQNQYAPMAGDMHLRQQISRKFGLVYGIEPDPASQVTITLGATEALFSAIQALVHPGDEVIVFDPAYDSYEPAVTLAGGKTIHLTLKEPSFTIDWAEVRGAINGRTRLIILNHPHNPTGAVCSEADLDALADCVAGTDVLILADEVYEHLTFDGRRPLSCAAHPRLKDRTLGCFSFGKTMHATGWRIGYAIAPRELTTELRRVHQFNTFSIASPMQAAIADFLKEEPGFSPGLSAFYERKRDYFLAALEGSRFRYTKTPGTYFQLLDYSAIANSSDMEFAERLLVDVGVASIPISPFCQTPFALPLLRFCFAKNETTLAAAAERLRKL